MGTEVLLDRVGKRSSALGFALVSLETEGDDYAVTFLRLDQAERLSALTAVAGRRVLALPFSR